MAVDLSRISADIPKLIAAVQTLPAMQAQIADLQAKLAAAPHDDPTVQTTLDDLASSMEAALAGIAPPAAPVTEQPAAPTDPASGSEPVADPNAPQGQQVNL